MRSDPDRLRSTGVIAADFDTDGIIFCRFRNGFSVLLKGKIRADDAAELYADRLRFFGERRIDLYIRTGIYGGIYAAHGEQELLVIQITVFGRIDIEFLGFALVLFIGNGGCAVRTGVVIFRMDRIFVGAVTIFDAAYLSVDGGRTLDRFRRTYRGERRIVLELNFGNDRIFARFRFALQRVYGIDGQFRTIYVIEGLSVFVFMQGEGCGVNAVFIIEGIIPIRGKGGRGKSHVVYESFRQ